MQTHFKMSCGSLTGGLRILQGAVRERSVGFKQEDKSMAGLEELEMVTERDECEVGETVSHSKSQTSPESKWQCKNRMDAFYKSWIIHSGSDKDGTGKKERERVVLGNILWIKKVKGKYVY